MNLINHLKQRKNRFSKTAKKVGGLFCLISLSTTAAANSVNVINLPTAWKMRDASTSNWQNAVVPGCVHTDLLRNKQIPDPFYRTNEKDLQWIDKKDWEYKTTFEISEQTIKNENLELVFKGLDTFADVYLNEQKVLSADNMFREWVVDAKKFLHVGKNDLRIYFHSPIVIGLELKKENGFKLIGSNDQAEAGGLKKDETLSSFIRKAPYHFGWDWGPRFVTSGVWQPVFIRAWSSVKMQDFYVQQTSLTDKLAKLNGQIEVQSTKNQTSIVEISNNGKLLSKLTVSLKQGSNILNLPFEIINPKRWWTNGLGEAYLYKLTAAVRTENSEDKQTREIGLRTLKLIQKKDSIGHSFYFELNGVPVFAKGENHIPNDMFADRVTKEVYDWEIGTAVKSNLNMLRVWGGGIYEDDYFYQLCDRNGILIWQDFMFACGIYPGNEKFLNSVTQEANYQVKRLRNHSCIALWCGNNEIDVAIQHYNKTGGWGWKKDYTEAQNQQNWMAYDTIFNHILAKTVQTLAPKIPYWQSSPSSIIPFQHANDQNKNGDVHYWGVWWGKHPFEKYADNIGRFMSEYGFQSFPELESIKKYATIEDYDIESEVMRHHQRSKIGNVTIKNYMDMYYQKPTDFQKFIYVGQVLQAYGIQFAIESHRRAMPYNMGSLVWQINDCWPVASWSSSDYYHRWKALQYEIKRSFEPVIISAYVKGENTSVKIVSDKLKDIPAQLEMTVCDFNGKVMQTRKLPIVIKANAVTSVLDEASSKFTDNVAGTYLCFSLKSKDEVLAEKTYFFTQPKNLELTKPTIVSKVEKQNSIWTITLKSNVLAKNLYLNFAGVEGFFSDNYFDVLPAKEYKVTFTPKDLNTSASKLEMMSLVDSYN
ncbi:MAG: glycoside hydrolase family 2 protein [Paludibacter sp.]